MSKNDFIPVNIPVVDGKEKTYLIECIDTAWISSEGPFVKRFEKEFAQKVGRKHGIAVANGSVALDVAIAALGIGSQDEIILPTFTIISCAAAIVRAGAIPVVVDCDPTTWNMDVGQIESRISSKTKAIIVVHTYGLPVDIDPVLSLAQKYHLKIIEDAAEAHGLNYKNLRCGSFGDISTFSFYPNKLVTTGEGGMVLTDDDNHAEKCRSLRNLCFQKKRRFIHEELGWNFRMSNLQAALGVAQLERLDEFIEKKRAIGKRYTKFLSDVSGIQLPLVETDYAQNIYWVYGIVLEDSLPFDADAAMLKLKQLGIGTRPFFWPMHKQPVFQKLGLFKNDSCPVAEKIAKRGFYIPSGLGLNEDQIERVAFSLKNIL
jgi:perosamine synthetase